MMAEAEEESPHVLSDLRPFQGNLEGMIVVAEDGSYKDAGDRCIVHVMTYDGDYAISRWSHNKHQSHCLNWLAPHPALGVSRSLVSIPSILPKAVHHTQLYVYVYVYVHVHVSCQNRLTASHELSLQNATEHAPHAPLRFVLLASRQSPISRGYVLDCRG